MSVRALFSPGGEVDPTAWASRERFMVLIVDDEPNVLSAIRRTFRNESYDVLTASSGEEALEVIANNEINLIISDYKMPGMSGGELLGRVRKLKPECIRILLTGYADTEAVMAAIKDGVVYRFILKPWNDDDLRITVALALEQQQLIRKNQLLENDNRQKTQDVAALARLTSSSRSQLAIMLHKKGLLTTQQLQKIYKGSHKNDGAVIRQLVSDGWVDEKRILNLLKDDFQFDHVDLREVDLDPALVAILPRSVCRSHAVIPLRAADKKLSVIMADPMDSGLIESLGFASGMMVIPSVASLSEIDQKLSAHFGESEADFRDLATLVSAVDPLESIQIVLDEDDDLDLDELLRGSDEPPAVRLVNAIIMEALRLSASDIHIQPRAKSVSVRYRIDGVLQEKIQFPLNLLLPIVSRIKVISELDISERRKPQDGRITVKSPTRIVDLRISTLPTINGEKVVMRVLDRQSSVKRIELLGLSSGNMEKILDVVTRPQGMILATGPTGSGKTTSLYAMLQHGASPAKNYVTIEDPVEFYVDMAGQVPVYERIGLNFSTVLRAILRQDPDVILLGEIRDEETADVAFHAALTGHLVYSTLHTNSATATIARLFDLGLKPYIVSSALEAIMAQRLLRRLCNHCKESAIADPRLLARLGPHFADLDDHVYVSRGCEHCNDGYSGRVPIHEVLIMSDPVRDAIADGHSANQLLSVAREQGMETLVEDARQKVVAGSTTLEEVLRVLGNQASANEGIC